MKFISHTCIICIIIIIVSKPSFGLEIDSVTKPQNYSFRSQLLVNYTSIGQTNRRTRGTNNQYNYRFQEFSLSGYLPVYEKKYALRSTNTEQASFTLLFTGSISSSRSYFNFASTQPILRLSAGFRALYYTGKKGIWMASLAPFVSEETKLFKNAVPRFFGSILYTRMVNEYFSYRLGISYSYLINGGTLLPILGFRVGDYQKVYLNFQIPRDISLVWTINNHWQTGIFSRVSGGIYRFNIDRKLDKFNNIEGKAVLYRTDLLSGIMLNYSPNSQWYFSLNAGIAHSRNINVAFTNEFIPTKAHVIDNGSASPAPFVNFSMAIYFGKPTYNGAYNHLIEQKAVNNSVDAGDFNLGNNQITNDMNRVGVNDINKKDLKKINDRYMDVKDFLMDE